MGNSFELALRKAHDLINDLEAAICVLEKAMRTDPENVDKAELTETLKLINNLTEALDACW